MRNSILSLYIITEHLYDAFGDVGVQAKETLLGTE